MKTVFPMFDRRTVRFAGMRMHDKSCQGHLEFRLASGNAGTGRASEAQLNMDVNLCRLPEKPYLTWNSPCPLQALSGIRIRRTVPLFCQSNGKTIYHQEKHVSRTAGIPHPTKKFFLHPKLFYPSVSCCRHWLIEKGKGSFRCPFHLSS